MGLIWATFTIEGNQNRPYRFDVSATDEAGQVAEIREMVAQEFGCHKADVEVVSVGKTKIDLKPAPAPAKTYPSRAEVAAMKKANIVVLAKELGIDADFEELKKADVADLVSDAIEAILTAPGK